MLNNLQSSIYTLAVLHSLPSLFVNFFCKIKNPILLSVDFKIRYFDTDRRDLHAFISKVDLPE